MFLMKKTCTKRLSDTAALASKRITSPELTHTDAIVNAASRLASTVQRPLQLAPRVPDVAPQATAAAPRLTNTVPRVPNDVMFATMAPPTTADHCRPLPTTADQPVTSRMRVRRAAAPPPAPPNAYGTSQDHYHAHMFLMKKTCTKRLSDTAVLASKRITSPELTHADAIVNAASTRLVSTV
ncbi:hypothetical protein THAOC_32939, partial [Thalassiosira oceanica]